MGVKRKQAAASSVFDCLDKATQTAQMIDL